MRWLAVEGSSEARREEMNRRLRNELRLDLAYPDITSGVPAALIAERD